MVSGRKHSKKEQEINVISMINRFNGVTPIKTNYCNGPDNLNIAGGNFGNGHFGSGGFLNSGAGTNGIINTTIYSGGQGVLPR